MTKEEYQRNLIRMFDSIRSNHKGEETCDGMDCYNCPFFEKVCSTKGIKGTLFHSYEAIEVVENWAKENPIVTNADKFRGVFGMEKLPFYSCIYTNKNCEDCEHFIGMGCKANSSFWNAEYKGGVDGE